MKTLSIILSLLFSQIQMGYSADSTQSCTTLDKKEIEELNLGAGFKRLSLMSNSATVMSNPALAKPVGNPSASQSADMYVANESYSAADLVANEFDNSKNSQSIAARCNSTESIRRESEAGRLQLFSQSCMIYELINKIVFMLKESDSLHKQMIEAKAASNKAVAEEAKRKSDVQKQKKELEEANKKITAAIKALDAAKKSHIKAEEALKKAQEGLKTAQAMPCTKVCSEDGEDCTEDCSARDAAVATAQKAVESASKDLDKAKKDLEKAVRKMIDLLVDKLGTETHAVLALMIGTMRGEVDGGDVTFKVSSSDFTLVDFGKVISGLTGERTDKASQLAGSSAEDTTKGYFEKMIWGYETSARENHAAKPEWDVTQESNGMLYLGMVAPKDSDSIREVLGAFGDLEKGADYLETIAMAVQDYKGQMSEKQINLLEAMKTPDSRLQELAKVADQKAELIKDMKTMIEKNICYLDSLLVSFKGFYQASAITNAKKDTFFEYINNFTTDSLKKKLREGYFSGINADGIRKKFECYADGGSTEKCKNVDAEADKEAVGSCHWSGAVFGPSRPITEVCDKTKIGQVAKNESGNELTCVCK